MNYNKIAERLDNAALEASPIKQISETRTLTIEEAYAVQTILMSRRYIRGERLCGLKLGFTSHAKMKQMGVSDMIWGRLTDAMEISNHGELDISKFIHPRAEPEIAFRFRKNVDKVLSREDLSEYIEGVCLAVEIIDSRYEHFKFSLEDVIADNCSSSAFILGEMHAPATQVSDLAMQLEMDGEMVQEGNSNAILGNPVESLSAISRLALSYGEPIRPGDIVLAGAATPAVFISNAEEVTAHARGLGSVSFKVSH